MLFCGFRKISTRLEDLAAMACSAIQKQNCPCMFARRSCSLVETSVPSVPNGWLLVRRGGCPAWSSCDHFDAGGNTKTRRKKLARILSSKLRISTTASVCWGKVKWNRGVLRTLPFSWTGLGERCGTQLTRRCGRHVLPFPLGVCNTGL